MDNKFENIPHAATLINSMRSIGYDFETAIADIIDNSITALAKNIDIIFPTSSQSQKRIEIIDDGFGMNREELIEAMRFGTVKNTVRNSFDLGRFGLGLKTASISQCRKFTVVSSKNDSVHGFYWDLDLLNEKNSWDMFELSQEGIFGLTPTLEKYRNKKSFTLVIWENFDTIQMDIDVFTNLDDVFIKKIEKMEKHVSLVFHRYLEEGLTISINGSPIKSIDPFLRQHPKTTIKPQQTIRTKTSDNLNEKVRMQVYILPYHKDLSKADLELLGNDAEADNQGFYIYRNRRLMIHGTWFRLKPKAELSRNARILVDIPNTLDDLWAIDIKKQKAKIPGSLMIQLKNEVTDAVIKSKKLHNYKGTEQTISGSIWRKVEDKRDGFIFYKVDEDSHLIKNLLTQFDDNALLKLRKLLKLVELSIPYRDIYNSVAEKKEINSIDDELVEELLDDALKMYKIQKQLSDNTDDMKIISNICKFEPYLSANIKEKLLEKINGL